MKRTKTLLIIAAATVLIFSCKETQKEEVLTKEVTFKKEGELRLLKASNDSLLVRLDIEIAENEYETQTGLMYRRSMQNDRGMLFIFESDQPRAFYMKNTEFSLDIIFINSAKEIVSIQKNAKPLDQSSLPSDGPAMYVLEVNAGLSDAWGLQPGDKIDWTVIN